MMVTLTRNFAQRVRYRLLDPVTPRMGTRCVRLFGSRIDLDLADPLQRLVYLRSFEPDETHWLLDYLQPGHVFVDGGANIGYFTLLAASRVGLSGRVLAVEPNPALASALEQTVARNALGQVTVIAAALASDGGELSLYLVSGSNNATAVPWEGLTEKPVTVAATSLDALAESRGLARIDCLKLDVEGFEPAALRGAEGLLAGGRIKAILCELNDKALREVGSSSDALRRTILGFGFRDTNPRPLRTDTWLENRFFTLP